MFLKLIDNKNFFIIFSLGLISGLPLALILSTLKATLFDNNFNLSIIGALSLLSLPYSLKMFVAPVFDCFSVPFLHKYFGHRKSWILLNQFCLILSCVCLAFAVQKNHLFFIIGFGCLIAVFSACQDIVIDAYRIEHFTQQDQGIATMLYIYGYRFGVLFAGGFALFLSTTIAWYLVYLIMAFTMFCLMLGIVFTHQNKKEQNNFALPFKKIDFFKKTWLFIIDAYRDLLNKKKWYFILLFIVFFKLTDAFAGNMIMPFLLDIGYSKQELAGVLKTFGLFATFVGVFLGAILVKKMTIRHMLYLSLFLQTASNLSFCYLAKSSNIYINFWYFNFDLNLLLTVLTENVSGGIGDVVFVAYLTSLCNKNFSATQYALFTSLGSLARSLLASSAGIYANYFGWYNFFIFSMFLAIPAIAFLFLIGKNNFLLKNN
jgi:PAT family beta-lactamase induction signal transducer AmpG